MGSQLIAPYRDSTAPVAPGKRDVANRSAKAAGSCITNIQPCSAYGPDNAGHPLPGLIDKSAALPTGGFSAFTATELAYLRQAASPAHRGSKGVQTDDDIWSYMCASPGPLEQVPFRHI